MNQNTTPSHTPPHSRSSMTTKPFKLNMFQCIIQVESDNSLLSIASHLSGVKTEHKLYAPGTLGKVVTDPIKYQIGSISIKQKMNGKNVSVLLFNTHKIKISGGMDLLAEDSTDESVMLRLSEVVRPLMALLYKDVEQKYIVLKRMFNATLYRSTSIGKKDFLVFIEKLTRQFGAKNVVLPDIMQRNGNQRGRICAVKVKQVYGKGSFAVDHGGNVQFFSYFSVKDLQKHKSELMNVWR